MLGIDVSNHLMLSDIGGFKHQQLYNNALSVLWEMHMDGTCEMAKEA